MVILQVVFDARGLAPSDMPAAGSAFAARAVEAAAAAHGLQSLSINTSAATRVNMPPSLLLPLLAVAGGPGSSIEKLELVGPFIAAAAAEADASQIASSSSLVSCCGAYPPPDMLLHMSNATWCGPLRQLSGLHELIVTNHGKKRLTLPVDCLPANLRMLKCSKMNIVSNTVSSLQSGSEVSSIIQEQHSIPRLADSDLVHKCSRRPSLHMLQLLFCWLESPCLLSSDKLQVLTIHGSSWSGDLQEAASAWPALVRLTCNCSALRVRLAVGRKVSGRVYIFPDVCEEFKALKYLDMTYLPFSAVREVATAAFKEPSFSNIKQVRFGILFDVDAVGCLPALQSCLQHLTPWADVQVAMTSQLKS